jgi:hypothetical protein
MAMVGQRFKLCFRPEGKDGERRIPAFRGRLAWVIAISALAVGLQHGTAVAQQRLLVSGTVQWATSNRIQVMSDANVSVNVDVSGLAQGSYPSLRSGDRVDVVGVVAPDRSRLIAESVKPGQPGGGYWSIFPEAP